MTEPSVSFAGNLTDDPEVRYTERGSPERCSAWPSRAGASRRRRSSPWSSGATRPSTPPQSLSKGSRVVVIGRLQQRSWTAAADGSPRLRRGGRGRGAGAKPGGRWRPRPGRRGARRTRGPARRFVRGPERTLGLRSCQAGSVCAPPPDASPSASDAAVSPVGGAEASSRAETTQRSPSSGTAPRMTAT